LRLLFVAVIFLSNLVINQACLECLEANLIPFQIK
jgi:hypothetical protein